MKTRKQCHILTVFCCGFISSRVLHYCFNFQCSMCTKKRKWFLSRPVVVMVVNEKDCVWQNLWIHLPCLSAHKELIYLKDEEENPAPACTHTISVSSFTSCRGHKTWFSHSVSPVFQTLLVNTHTLKLISPVRGCVSTLNAPNYLAPSPPPWLLHYVRLGNLYFLYF